MTNLIDEYFAELSMWYFGSHGEYVDRENSFPAAGRQALKMYDEDGFRLLEKIYEGHIDKYLPAAVSWQRVVNADPIIYSPHDHSLEKGNIKKEPMVMSRPTGSSLSEEKTILKIDNQSQLILKMSWLDWKSASSSNCTSDSSFDKACGIIRESYSSDLVKAYHYHTIYPDSQQIQETYSNHLWLFEAVDNPEHATSSDAMKTSSDRLLVADNDSEKRDSRKKAWTCIAPFANSIVCIKD